MPAFYDPIHPSPGGFLPPGYSLVSPTADLTFRDLLERALGAMPTGFPSFQDVLGQGLRSPLLQTILAPALRNLLPGEELARERMQDVFRGAGAIGGGAHGVALSRLENALQGQRGNLISQVIANFLPNIIAGYGQQMKAATIPSELLLSALGGARPSLVTDQGGFGGAGGAGGGGGTFDPGGFLESFRRNEAQFGVTPYGPGSPWGSAPGTLPSTVYGDTGPLADYRRYGIDPFSRPDDLSRYTLGGGAGPTGSLSDVTY